MPSRDDVVAAVRGAFGVNEYPGDAHVVGSSEGCEPEQEAGSFRGRHDWQIIPAEFLDEHYVALSFFSEAGFRFFLPAYLVADLHEQLRTADALFHLTAGFSDIEIPMRVGERRFLRTSGKSTLINPGRYGAMTQLDYTKMRLSVFTREEAATIVEYLRWKREKADSATAQAAIDAALDGYWLERATTAPSAQRLRQHLQEEAEFARAIQRKNEL